MLLHGDIIITMTWEHLALWIPAVICVITAVYTAGVLAQTVRTHEIRLDKHSETLEKHKEKLEAHSIGINEAASWYKGFTAGTNRG